MKTTKTLLALLLIACMVLTACGGSDGETTAVAGETTAPAAETTEAAKEDTTAAEAETTEADAEGGPVEARLVRVAYTGIADSFEPINVPPSVASNVSYAQTYVGLLRRGDDYSIVPCIADSYEVSDDALTYTFKLNPNATFSNGEKITAEDCVFTFANYQVSTSKGYSYTATDTFTAVDDETFVITMKSPDPRFLSVVAGTGIVSKNAYDAAGGFEKYGQTIETVVSSGPYVVTDWQPSVSMTFKAREDFWLGEVEIKDLELYCITDTNGAMVSMQTGDLDVYWNPVSGSAYETLKAADGVYLAEYQAAKYENIHMYYKSGLYSDVRMRQAVAYATKNEDALAIGVDGMGYTTRYPGDNPTFTANPNYDSPYAISYDLEKAKALVEECGNVGAQTVIKSYQPDPYPALSTWLQSVLSSIGLDASVEVMERGAWLDACNAEQIEILILSWNGSAYDMDESFCDVVNPANVGTSGNYGWYDNQAMSDLIAKERQLPSADQRAEVFKEMIDLMWQDVPLVPLYGVNAAIPINTDITVANPRSYCMFDYKWAK